MHWHYDDMHRCHVDLYVPIGPSKRPFIFLVVGRLETGWLFLAWQPRAVFLVGGSGRMG